LQLFWINDCFLNWSSLQKEVVKIKFFDDSITQSTIASKLKINQSLVSRTIKAAKYDKYIASEKAIIDLINMEYNL
jgi:DNA-binding transcriptional regulator LsrR (DeoR family)